MLGRKERLLSATPESGAGRGLPALMRPLQEFISTETLGGILLLVATIAALAWVNAPFGDSYLDFWDSHISIDLNFVRLDESLRDWVNDGLMTIFFFVVGLEIKREVLRGELAEPRKAALPVVAAAGGMIVPAAIFLALNAGHAGERGWGIPMATDIAFAVGVLTLLGPRVPVSLKVFLLALAIADDLGAIAVIAVFYTDSIAFGWLAVALAMFALTALLGRAGVRPIAAYVAVGIGAWLGVHESGIHATVAGVVLGLLTPIAPFARTRDLAESAEKLVEQADDGPPTLTLGDDAHRRRALRDLESLSRDSRPVLARLEHALHPWTSYAIVPIFALANAGVVLNGDIVGDAASSRVTAGIVLGLVVGKPAGIVLFAWLAVKLRLAALPGDAGWRQLVAVAMVAGIGFTVSLFITGLAFDEPLLVSDAKIGVLAGSAIIGVAGFAALWASSRREPGLKRST